MWDGTVDTFKDVLVVPEEWSLKRRTLKRVSRVARTGKCGDEKGLGDLRAVLVE